jgi:hypothetical protein
MNSIWAIQYDDIKDKGGYSSNILEHLVVSLNIKTVAWFHLPFPSIRLKYLSMSHFLVSWIMYL